MTDGPGRRRDSAATRGSFRRPSRLAPDEPGRSVAPDPARTHCYLGLRLRDDLAFDDWVDLGGRLAQLSSASAWCLGDWLRYGERKYGRRYKVALETTSFDYQTLRNYAWVAGHFAAERRLASLSFQHHAEVAALPEAAQDLWLRRAERLRWSRNELRRQLRKTLTASDADRPSPIVVRIQIQSSREHRWRQAAAAASQDLPEWVAQAADEAAERVLIEPTLSDCRQERDDDRGEVSSVDGRERVTLARVSSGE